jgi:hypothetical protein
MKKNQMILTGAAIVAATGLALGAASYASADEGSGTSTTAPGYSTEGQGGTGQGGMGHGMGRGGAANGNTDPTKPMRSDEKLLTGDALAKVTAAAKAKEPGATIQRVETDSDGVYEAHMVRADGTQITVQVGADFAVTDVHEGGPGGHGGPGGDASQDGSTSTPSGTATSGT